MLQVAVLANHQNGRDTHIRQASRQGRGGVGMGAPGQPLQQLLHFSTAFQAQPAWAGGGCEQRAARLRRAAAAVGANAPPPAARQPPVALHTSPPPPHPHVALPCRCACLGRAATWRAPSDRKPPLPRPSWRPSLACGDDACARQQSVHSVFSVPRLRSPLLRLDVLPPCSASECTPSPACHHPAWQRRPLVCFPFFQWLPPNCFPAVLPSPFSVPLLPAPLSQTMLQVRTR